MEEKDPDVIPANKGMPEPAISGANPMIASFNAGAVKNYSATCCLVRFYNKNILFFYFEKRSTQAL
jgi:hypothetical protein